MQQWQVTATVFTGDVSKGIDTSIVLPPFVFDTEQHARDFVSILQAGNRTLDRSKDTGRVFISIMPIQGRK